MSADILLTDMSDADVDLFRAQSGFDEQWYVTEYPDVAKSGIDPALHYLWIGRKLGRLPSGDGLLAATSSEYEMETETGEAVETPLPAPAQEGPDVRLIEKVRRAWSPESAKKQDGVYEVVAQYFDQDYYLTTYPDVAAAKIDPIQHYLDNGWLENRDPSLEFSTRYYVENNPDVVAAGVNPFFHFVAAGKAEGRAGKHQLGFRWDILANLKPVLEQISELKSYRLPPTLADSQKLLSVLQSGLSSARRSVLSFSHDDFTQNVGGIQLLLRRELALFRARNDLHIHLFPLDPLPFLDTSGEIINLGVIINGEFVGNFAAPEIAHCLAETNFADYDPTFVVHSLLGHNMDQTIEIIKSTHATEGCVWIHDYSPIYNNFKLLRNDVEYCGFPRPNTLARELCEFARAPFSHADEFSKLFGQFKIRLLSPSKAALSIWNSSGLLKPASAKVVEHVRLKPVAETESRQSGQNRPLRVGFLGYPATHKGWPVFQEIVLKYGGDPRYEFHHLGKGRRGGLQLMHTEVVANESRLDAMRQAVAEVELDVAILWSIWPETFCLTAYEALAGGAALVTNVNAGNIVAVTEQTGLGVVLSDEAALDAAFQGGDLLGLSRSRRPASMHSMQYSSVSLEVMD